MRSSKLIRMVIFFIAIILWALNYKIVAMLIISIMSLYSFYELQRKAYIRKKFSTSEKYKNIQIEEDCMIDVGVVSCRGNIYEIYRQNVDLLLDRL